MQTFSKDENVCRIHDQDYKENEFPYMKKKQPKDIMGK